MPPRENFLKVLTGRAGRLLVVGGEAGVGSQGCRKKALPRPNVQWALLVGHFLDAHGRKLSICTRQNPGGLLHAIYISLKLFRKVRTILCTPSATLYSPFLGSLPSISPSGFIF